VSVLSKPYFHCEEAAFAHVEKVLWPQGPVCPHCKNADEKPIYDLKKTRIGLRKCRACDKQFTVRVGTVFESSHVPMTKWLQAVYLMCASKKGVSAHQLHRTLEVTYKTAWFMEHRLREAMRSGALAPLGGQGKTVEVDETFYGRKGGYRADKGRNSKMKVISLVERGGSVRSVHVPSITRWSIETQVAKNVARETRLMSDNAPYYRRALPGMGEHQIVDHSKGEYVRGDAYTNTVEGFFSIFKRGMGGVYQHCAEKHLHRYLAEFDFRYNNRQAVGVNDTMRAEAALVGIVGKRLTYRDSFV
jgi:transposase-like protein